MPITITIDTSNAAFDGDELRPEVARILREAAKAFEEGHVVRRLYDVNGNRVGDFDFVAEQRPTKYGRGAK